MKRMILELAALADLSSIRFNPFDPATLCPDVVIDPAVANYFAECVPASDIDLEVVTILSPQGIEMENREMIPGCRCSPHGFITIARDMGGDSFSVDITDGKIYEISHGKFGKKSISPGWNTDHTAFLPDIPINRANIIATAEETLDSIEEFLIHCRYWATEENAE